MEFCRHQGLLASPYEVVGDRSRVESDIDMVPSDSESTWGLCTWVIMRPREEQAECEPLDVLLELFYK